MPKRTGITQFVIDHPKLTNDQIVEAAKENGLSFSSKQVMHARWAITYKMKKARGKGSAKHKRSVTERRASLQKWEPAKPRTVAPRVAAQEAKVAQLRRLIFELGFDTSREVFEFFENAHQQMK